MGLMLSCCSFRSVVNEVGDLGDLFKDVCKGLGIIVVEVIRSSFVKGFFCLGIYVGGLFVRRFVNVFMKGFAWYFLCFF